MNYLKLTKLAYYGMTTDASTFFRLNKSAVPEGEVENNGVLRESVLPTVFEAAVLVGQDFPLAHSAWQRIMASLHSTLRISPCKSAASGGMRAGKQPGVSRPPWSKHSGLDLITNARRRLRSRVNRFCTRCR
jgi:hypothetical protein